MSLNFKNSISQDQVTFETPQLDSTTGTANNPKAEVMSVLENSLSQNLSVNETTEKIYQLTQTNPDIVAEVGVPEDFQGIKTGIVEPYFASLRALGQDHLEYNLSQKSLVWYDGQGNELAQDPAVSGTSKLKPLPIGEYTLAGKPRIKNEKNDPHWKSFCDPQQNCWAQTITPDFKTNRTLLAIHPDGGAKGTAGCIGLQNDDTQTFKDQLQSELANNPKLKLMVRP